MVCMFPAASDGAGNIGSLRGTFEKVREEAGLPGLHFHDTRHFFASVCVASGVDFMTISKWLGHGDGGMLVGRVYGHISNEHAQRAAKRISFENVGRAPQAAETNAVNPHELSVEELLLLLKQKTVKP